MCESLISRYSLLITDAESGVKRRFSKLLLECSMRQLHNELITSPDDGSLFGAIKADTNDVIFSDDFFFSTSPTTFNDRSFFDDL